MTTITLPGRCVSKKNSKRIFKTRRKTTVLPSKAYEVWHKRMIPIIRKQFKGPTITGPVNLQCVFFYTADDYDLDNHIQSVEDLLQDAKVIADDNQVKSLDGSAKVVMCPRCDHRGVYVRGPKAGQRKPDCGATTRCPFVRCLAILTPYVESPEITAMTDELLQW